MTRRKVKERPKREGLNMFQQCDGGHAQRNHCVQECGGDV